MDPEKDQSTIKLDQLYLNEVLKKDLKVMNTTAFTLIYENQNPVMISSINVEQ